MVERAVLICVVSLLVGDVSVAAAENEAARRAALVAADELQDLTGEIARGLWDLSETALRENRSAELLAGVLAAEGFAVETGVAGMPTAFVASWGEGRPIIGVLAEYDALPAIGHACGHNLIEEGGVRPALSALGYEFYDHGYNGDGLRLADRKMVPALFRNSEWFLGIFTRQGT